MAIGVDTSRWKPRQIRGTPAARSRKIVGICVVGYSLAWYLFYQFSDRTANFRKYLVKWYEEPIEEIERRQIIGLGLPVRTGDKIRRLIKEEERLDVPRKENE